MPEPIQRITQPTLDVLAALLDSGELHGYEAFRTTRHKDSTVYKILKRLARTGWCTTRQEIPKPHFKRGPRLYYRLTPEAAKQTHQLLLRHRPGYAGAVQQLPQPAADAA
jgi:PadR family transcriptional regulator